MTALKVKSSRNVLSFLMVILSLTFFLCGVSYSQQGDTVSPSESISLGKDSYGNTWYLMDYSRSSSGTIYAVLREYYSDQTTRNERIQALISDDVPSSKASSLYFSEGRVEYTSDGKQYRLTELTHYDMLGNEIVSETYSNRTYSDVVANSIAELAFEYARDNTSQGVGGSSSGGCNSGLLSLCVIFPLFAFFKKK